jgi:hypothetical protein
MEWLSINCGKGNVMDRVFRRFQGVRELLIFLTLSHYSTLAIFTSTESGRLPP